MSKRRRRPTAAPKSHNAPRERARGVSRLSVSELHRELRRRQRSVKTLHGRRARVLAKIAELDAQIMAAGGTVDGVGESARGGLGRKRPKNDSSLVEALRKALTGKTMSVAEAAEAVQKAGYQSSAANFRTIVNFALLKKQHFKRVERGQYTVA